MLVVSYQLRMRAHDLEPLPVLPPVPLCQAALSHPVAPPARQVQPFRLCHSFVSHSQDLSDSFSSLTN